MKHLSDVICDPHDEILTKTRPIKSLVGDFTENIGQSIFDSFSEDSNGRYIFELNFTMFSDELIEHALMDDYDFALIIVNNLTFDPDEKEIKKRFESANTLVSVLRYKYALPVIALYGHPRDSSLAKALMANGAEFASLIPCPWEDVVYAINKCISPIADSPIDSLK